MSDFWLCWHLNYSTNLLNFCPCCYFNYSNNLSNFWQYCHFHYHIIFSKFWTVLLYQVFHEICENFNSDAISTSLTSKLSKLLQCCHFNYATNLYKICHVLPFYIQTDLRNFCHLKYLHKPIYFFRVDFNDANECFELVKNLVLETPAEPYLLSILQHLLFIRDDELIRWVLSSICHQFARSTLILP